MQTTTPASSPARPAPPAARKAPQDVRARLLAMILKNEAQRKAPPG